MALDKQNVQAVFGNTGEDTKSDPNTVQGKWLTLENAILRTRNSFRKRNGYAALGSGLTTGKAIAAFKNELTVYDGASAYSLNQSTANFTNKGAAAALELSAFPVVRNNYQQTTADCAFHSAGIAVFTWEDARGGARYSVFDTATSQAIIQDVQLSATAYAPKPMALGAYIIIVFGDTSTNHLRYTYVAASNPTVLGTITDIATDINTTNPVFDCVAMSSRIYIAYNKATAGIGFTYLDASLVLNSIYTVSTEVASGCMALIPDASNSRLWCAYYNGSAVKGLIVNSALNSTALAATVVETVASVRNLTGYLSGTTATLYYEISAAATYNNFIRKNTLTAAGSAGTASVFLRSVGLMAKCFTHGSTTYLGVTFESTLQPTYFFVDTSGNIVAKVSPGTGGGLTKKSVLREVVSLTADQFTFAYLQKDLLTTISGAVYTQTGVMCAKLDFGSITAYGKARLGNNLLLTGGFASMYDGASVVEHGFHIYPENLSISTGTIGGGIAPGTYEYRSLYEWMDNQGNLHRSAPSVGTSVNLSTAATTLTGLGSTVSGANTIQNFPISVGSKLVPGMTVTGNGIPANTVFSDSIASSSTTCTLTLTNNATATQSNILFSFAPQQTYECTTTNGSNQLTNVDTTFLNANGENIITVFGDVISGSNLITVRTTNGLKVGQQVFNQTASFSGPLNALITAINGNVLTIDTPPAFTATNISISVRTYASGVVTSGSPTVTGLSATHIAFFFVGQKCNVSQMPSPATVVSIGASSVTFGTNATGNDSSSRNVFCYPPLTAIFQAGQSISGTGIPASTTITSVSSTALTISNTATATANSVIITSSAVFVNAVAIPTLRLTAKQNTRSPIVIKLYRTQANLTRFYLVSSVTAPTYNDTTVDSVTISDGLGDSAIIGNEVLYTDGGVIENIAPPGFIHLSPYQDRLIGINAEDRLEAWYTKPIVKGAPAEWSDSFTIRVNERGGDLAASSELDGKLILWKAKDIFYTAGDGPASTGVGNEFPEPQRLNVTEGLSDVKSLAQIPEGILFKSKKGWHLLDRSLAVSYIGADVEGYNSHSVTSATLITDANQVRYTLDNGTALVYDFEFGQWYTFPNHSAVDADVFGDEFTYLTSAGVALTETPGTFSDNGSFIPMKVQTGWFSFGGIQGFQRVYSALILASYKSAHKLQVQVAYDFDSTVKQTLLINATSLFSTGVYEFKIEFTQQKCSAIQLTFTDVYDGVNGESLALTSLAFQVGVKPGLNRLPSSRSFSS